MKSLILSVFIGSGLSFYPHVTLGSDMIPCEGRILTQNVAQELLGSNDNFLLSPYSPNQGFVPLVIYNADGTQASPTTAFLRPTLKVGSPAGDLILELERRCQGSYGHGVTCSVGIYGQITCPPLPSTPQCSGWGTDLAAGISLSGFMTDHCLMLTQGNGSQALFHVNYP